MEHWITRGVALLVALGALGLFWVLGMFAAPLIEQGRLMDLNGAEMQLVGIPLGAGLATFWGALHLFALADKESNPALYKVVRIAFALAAVGAIWVGANWSLARVVTG